MKGNLLEKSIALRGAMGFEYPSNSSFLHVGSASTIYHDKPGHD
jgi:hypothetical protein